MVRPTVRTIRALPFQADRLYYVPCAQYPRLTDNNAGREVLLIAPDTTAGSAWRVRYLR